MGLARSIGEQLARPQGLAGRALGRVLDLANRKPTRLALDMVAPRNGETILDAGCGTGAAAEALQRRSPGCHVIGVDHSETMIRIATRRARRLGYEERCTFRSANLHDLPFATDSFDAVLALNVFYFCDPESRMIAELRRVLRPGGRLVAYVTEGEAMSGWAFARSGTHRLFSADGLFAAIAAAGFAPGRIHVEKRTVTNKISGLLAHAGA